MMGWNFGLSIECGKIKSNADDLQRYFQNKKIKNEFLLGNIGRDEEGNYWFCVGEKECVVPGIHSYMEAMKLTKTGLLLYKFLQSAPAFRFAIAGIETDEFRTESEFEPGELDGYFPGLVMKKDLFLKSIYQNQKRFKKGYIWWPYRGEEFKARYPLEEKGEQEDQLRKLLGDIENGSQES